jgi:2-keto-4-pentenoate hydratase
MSTDPSALAALLLAARKGGPAVSPSPTPPDLATAYAIQDRVAAALGGIAGWKGGPVDPAAVRASAIVAGGVVRSPATFDGRDFRIIGVEGEIAFVLARGFAAGAAPSDAEVLDAVASAHVAIEVCDTRIEPWRDVDALWKLADFQANRGLVLGDAAGDWRTRDFAAQPAAITADGARIGGRTGFGPTGEPRAVLCSIVRHLCATRGGVAAGAAVTTGSWTGLELVQPGARVVCSFAGIGSAEVTF